MPRRKKTSSEDGAHPYERAGFWIDPINHFWNCPPEVTIDKNGGVDIFLESTPAAKVHFEKFVKRQHKLAARKVHNL